MRKTTFLLLLFICAIGYSQQPVSYNENTSTITSNPFLNMERGGGDCGIDIPNFTTLPSGGGPTSQDFETANDAFDNQAADDFTLTADGTICQVNISGTVNEGGFPADPNSMVIMEIWDDAGGLPGTMIYSESFIGADVDPDGDGIFTVLPTDGPVLTAGTTYWLSIIAQLDLPLGGQWFWDLSADTLGNPYAWQNPGNGFDIGCPSWSDGNTCLAITGPDLAMDISFASAVLNDDPETAANLTVGEVFEDFPELADNTEATATAIDDPSCGNFAEADIWYSVTVPDSGDVTVETQTDDGSINDTALSIYEGEVGSLVEVVCNDDGGIGLFSLAEVEDRTPGEVLFVRVWEWNGGSLGTFQISAYDTPPPANDDPEGAIPLMIGAVFEDFPVTASNVSATDTAIDDPLCGNYAGGDVWFSVVAPSTGQFTVETDTAGGINDTAMEVYTGEIGSLVALECDDDDGNGLFSLADVDDAGLAGATLFVRVWEWGGGGFGPFMVSAYSNCPVFAGSIETVPSGQTEVTICTGDELPDPIDVAVIGDTVGTNSGWIITDNSTGEILALPAAPPFDLEGVFPGTCAIYYVRYEDGLMGLDMGSNIADLDGCFDLSNPILVERIDEGGVCEMCEYTLVMTDTFGDGWNGATMDVLVDGVVVLDDIALDDAPDADGALGTVTFPVNSTADVTTAFGDPGGFPGEISYNILDTEGNVVGSGDAANDIMSGTLSAECPSCPPPINLNATNFVAGGTVDISWDDGLSNALGYIWEIQDVGVPQGDPGAIASGSTLGMTTDTASGPFIVGNEYTLYVQAFCSDDEDGSSIFTSFDFIFPPDNDVCENAFPIACGETVTGSTAIATDTGQNPSPDVFYTFTGSGVEEIVTLSLCDGGTDYDSILRVFDDACNLVNEIAVNDDSCGVQSQLSFLSDGTTIYTIMIEGFATASGNFSLAVTCSPLPENDDCEDAIALECGTTVTSNTIGATDSGQNPSPDVFYTYTGNGEEEFVTLSLCDGGTDFDSILRVFDDACNLVNEIAVNDDFCGGQSQLSFISDGTTTYTIMVEGFGTASGVFSLAVTCDALAPPGECTYTLEMFDSFGDGWNGATINVRRDGLLALSGVALDDDPANDGTTGTLTFDIIPGEDITTELVTPGDFPGEISYNILDVDGNIVASGDAVTDVVSGTINANCEGLSVDDNGLEGFSFYPNPAQNVLNISAQTTVRQVSIVNLIGQSVYEQTLDATTSQLDISRLSAGTYLMQVVTVDGGVGTYKLIKQ